MNHISNVLAEKTNNLILFGFKCAGKSFLGKILADRFDLRFVDTDHLIEKKYNQSIRKLHQDLGEAGFREVESETIFSLKKDSSVIALGGGAVLNPKNVEHLQTIGHLIFLDTPFDVIEQRVFADGVPSFVDPKNPKKSLRKIYDERRKIYESIPAIKLSI